MADQDQAGEATQEQGQGLVVEVEASTPVDKVPYEIEVPEEADGRVFAKFQFPIGEDIQEDIELYGDETVRNFWLRQATVKAQAAIRRELQNGTHPDDIAEALNGWRPDVQHTTQKDPKAVIKQQFAGLSAEEKAELIALLEEQTG